MASKIGGGILATLALAAVASAHAEDTRLTAHSTLIAACGFADGRSARVTMENGQFKYEFGREAVSEIELVGDPQKHNVFKSVASFPRVGWTQLRFVNGTTSYVLFHYFNLGNYVRGYEGATERSGLLVFQSGRRVAMRLCRTEEGLEDGKDLTALPDDPEDYSNDIIDDIERHH